MINNKKNNALMQIRCQLKNELTNCSHEKRLQLQFILKHLPRPLGGCRGNKK